MKTFSAKSSDIKREWFIIDAEDQILGDVAVRAASLLRERTSQYLHLMLIREILLSL